RVCVVVPVLCGYFCCAMWFFLTLWVMVGMANLWKQPGWLIWAIWLFIPGCAGAVDKVLHPPRTKRFRSFRSNGTPHGGGCRVLRVHSGPESSADPVSESLQRQAKHE